MFALFFGALGCSDTQQSADCPDTSDHCDSDVVLQDADTNHSDSSPDMSTHDAELVCPPPGPYGYEVGTTATNLTFLDCDGNPVQLHDLCGAQLGMVISFYGWCTSCYDWARLANELQEQHRPDGLMAMIVITEDPLSKPATAEYCSQLRDHMELTTLVLYDEQAALEAYGTTDLVLLLDPYGKIIFNRRDATENAVRRAVEAALAM